ncbi:MAG: carboxypeptidase-like regulatory domain-containing protein [Alphaproteobacteria bacterium]|nr:carboxypeptidase-like regulatory domain-containing protein [Alphaproteobacteria bacterium]
MKKFLLISILLVPQVVFGESEKDKCIKVVRQQARLMFADFKTKNDPFYSMASEYEKAAIDNESLLQQYKTEILQQQYNKELQDCEEKIATDKIIKTNSCSNNYKIYDTASCKQGQNLKDCAGEYCKCHAEVQSDIQTRKLYEDALIKATCDNVDDSANTSSETQAQNASASDEQKAAKKDTKKQEREAKKDAKKQEKDQKKVTNGKTDTSSNTAQPVAGAASAVAPTTKPTKQISGKTESTATTDACPQTILDQEHPHSTGITLQDGECQLTCEPNYIFSSGRFACIPDTGKSCESSDPNAKEAKITTLKTSGETVAICSILSCKPGYNLDRNNNTCILQSKDAVTASNESKVTTGNNPVASATPIANSSNSKSSGTTTTQSTITISGMVVDENENPLPHANVFATNQTDIGNPTDFDGKFVIDDFPTSEQKISISFMGYKTQQKQASECTLQTPCTIRLEQDNTQLEGVDIVATAVCGTDEVNAEYHAKKTKLFKRENPGEDESKYYCAPADKNSCADFYKYENGECVSIDGDNCFDTNKHETSGKWKCQTDGNENNTACSCVNITCESGYKLSEDGKRCVLSNEHSEAELKEKSDNVNKLRDNEQSLANRMTSAVSMGAMGIGGMMLAQSLSEQRVDKESEQDMDAYLATFRCEYAGGNPVPGGTIGAQLPADKLFDLYQEYVTLAADVQEAKSQLGLKPGIESEVVLDKANIALYDDTSTGTTNGTYASLYRALSDSSSMDAQKWNDQKAQTNKNLKIGIGVVAGGAALGEAGNILTNYIDWDNSEAPNMFKEGLKSIGMINVDKLKLNNIDWKNIDVSKIDFSKLTFLKDDDASKSINTTNQTSFENSLKQLGILQQ